MEMRINTKLNQKGSEKWPNLKRERERMLLPVQKEIGIRR